jgi:hypothetical protein
MVVILVAAVFIAIQRGLQLRRLVQNGVPGTATIERMWSTVVATGMSRYSLRYTFRAGDGREYSRSIMISSGERERLKVGDTVAVIYLADNPKISALAELVEQARRALEK